MITEECACCFHKYGSEDCLRCNSFDSLRSSEKIDAMRSMMAQGQVKDILDSLNRAHHIKTIYKRPVDYSANPGEIRNVIFNDPATIVFWGDGTKTVVKCQEGDAFDPEKGLAMAIVKKTYGNRSNYCNRIKKWTEKYEEEHPIDFGELNDAMRNFADWLTSTLTGKNEEE